MEIMNEDNSEPTGGSDASLADSNVQREDAARPPGKKVSLKRRPGPQAKPEGNGGSDDGGGGGAQVMMDDEVRHDVLPSGKARLPATPALTERRRKEDESISNWLGALKGSGAAIRVSVARLRPNMFMGKNTKGFIETVPDTLSEEQIKQMYGGGTYELRVTKRNEQGAYVYWGGTTVEVEGDPRVDVLANQQGTGMQQPGAGDQIVTKAMGIMERELESAREYRNRPAPQPMMQSSGIDAAQLTAVLRPMEIQIHTLTAQLEAKDKQISDLVAAKNERNPFEAQLLSTLMDGDSARVTQIRTLHESEIRMLKEQMAATEARLRDQFDRDLKMVEIRHAREIDQQRASYERTGDAFKQMGDVQKEVLTGQVRALERENTELKNDVKVLRDKKEPSLLDKAKELEAVRNAIGSDSEPAEKSTLEKVADAALTSEPLFAMLNKWVGPKAGAAQAQQQIQQQQHPKLVRNRKTGKVFRHVANGEYEEVTPPRKKPVAQAKTPQAAGAQGEAAPGEQAVEEEEIEVELDPGEVKMAVAFLESAFRNNVDINNLVTTARTAVPESIVVAIRDLGVDVFLTKVVKLSSTSPLSSQAGRNWSRKLAKALVGEG